MDRSITEPFPQSHTSHFIRTRASNHRLDDYTICDGRVALTAARRPSPIPHQRAAARSSSRLLPWSYRIQSEAHRGSHLATLASRAASIPSDSARCRRRAQRPFIRRQRSPAAAGRSRAVEGEGGLGEKRHGDGPSLQLMQQCGCRRVAVPATDKARRAHRSSPTCATSQPPSWPHCGRPACSSR